MGSFLLYGVSGDIADADKILVLESAEWEARIMLEISGRILLGLPTPIIFVVFIESEDPSREPEPEVSLLGVVDKEYIETKEWGVRESLLVGIYKYVRETEPATEIRSLLRGRMTKLITENISLVVWFIDL